MHGQVASGLRQAGEFTVFSWHVVRALPTVGTYAAELIRQTGVLVFGSAVVVLGLQFVAGAECGLFGAYALRPTGASGQTGLFSQVCGLRELFPYMYGYVVAAKIGCGLVAEIGSMRIADELDALDVMGTPAIRFVGTTRLASAIIALPMLYIIAMGIGLVGTYLVVVHQVGDISAGAFFAGYFGRSHGFSEDLLSGVKAMVIGLSVVLVGLYYGYTASGGPEGVGRATARSMIVNLILIHVLGGTMTALFWGANIHLPLGG
jgi:phospholipid/cholesterol/gamma-HCH transport system permease protein